MLNVSLRKKAQWKIEKIRDEVIDQLQDWEKHEIEKEGKIKLISK